MMRRLLPREMLVLSRSAPGRPELAEGNKAISVSATAMSKLSVSGKHGNIYLLDGDPIVGLVAGKREPTARTHGSNTPDGDD